MEKKNANDNGRNGFDPAQVKLNPKIIENLD